MRIEAKHVKRKELIKYLPNETIKKGIKTPLKLQQSSAANDDSGNSKNDESIQKVRIFPM